MSKVICDICGTSYPESAGQCPICGYNGDIASILGDDDLELWDMEVPEPATSVQGSTDPDELPEEPESPKPAKAAKSQSGKSAAKKGGKFSQSTVLRRDKEDPPYEVQPAEDAPAEEAEDTHRDSNGLLVVLLVVVIVALLTVTGYICVRYFLPNVIGDPAEETVATESTEVPTQPTEPAEVSCTDIALINGGRVELGQPGQHWLMNVVVLPGDCTDKLSFASSDESVATVNQDGRITAVGEGSCIITISCGERSLECQVICEFPEETTEPADSEEPK